MASVMSASCYITSVSHYHPPYQSRSSMYIRGLIPWNIAELAEAVPIEYLPDLALVKSGLVQLTVSYTEGSPQVCSAGLIR